MINLWNILLCVIGDKQQNNNHIAYKIAKMLEGGVLRAGAPKGALNCGRQPLPMVPRAGAPEGA
jgi:hypothetical protein